MNLLTLKKSEKMPTNPCPLCVDFSQLLRNARSLLSFRTLLPSLHPGGARAYDGGRTQVSTVEAIPQELDHLDSSRAQSGCSAYTRIHQGEVGFAWR